MKLFYDFHIHTALSPCAENDMTPNNITNMAVLKELSAIAITDHNSAGNAAAVMEAAKNAGHSLVVIPGMEAESAEEIHVVCLFPKLERALKFGKYIADGLPQMKNRPDIFGEQLVMDEFDNVTSQCEQMLSTATMYGISEIAAKARELGGVAYPAHIDREYSGIISVLGHIPPELDINLVEISKRWEPEEYIKQNPELSKYKCMRSSDAHCLWDISERENYLEYDGPLSAEGIIGCLRDL